ncbi:hypothetical protein Ancab_020631 [Ancistrocladus abbreviatus]
MGAEISTLPVERRVYTVSPTYAIASPPVISRAIAFHSLAQWRAYFEASKQSNKLIVIDFTAAWCGPCRSMEPTIDEFAAKYTDVDFVKIDVDELMGVARQFAVQAMPTFLFIKMGKEVDKVTGAKKQELQQKIEKHRTYAN